jgi:F-box associated protein
MPVSLLNLPNELLENILVLLCRKNARTIQACRQTCRTLKTTIVQSTLVQYLERLALHGMHDPQILIGDGGSVTVSPSAMLGLPDRMAALQAWEEEWNSFGDRIPDLFISSPFWPSISSLPSMTNITATILDPEPYLTDIQWEWPDVEERVSFGPRFITSTRFGKAPAAYSYLDLHGCLDGAGAGTGNKSNDEIGGYDRVDWTVIDIPLRNVAEIALSAELDLAVVISCVFPSQTSSFSSLILVLIMSKKTTEP